MRRLTDYAWEDDDGTLHLDVERALKATGFPVTQENIDALAELLAEAARMMAPDTSVEVQE